MEHEAKAAEIVDAAEELMLRDGYEATTIAAIARRAGVSSNAIYWYYPGKDELLAAVMRRRLEKALTRIDAGGARVSLSERATAVLAELDSTAALTAAVHERAQHSPAVAEFHDDFHAAVEGRAREALLAAGLSEPDSQMGAAALIAIVEGIHLHDLPTDAAARKARDQLVLWVLGRLTASPSPG